MAKKRILLRKKKSVDALWFTGFRETISKNRRVFLSLGIGILIILILLVSGYFYYTRYKDRAMNAFIEGSMLYNEVTSTEGEKKNLKDYEDSIALFKKVISSYPRSKVTPLAYLSLGDIYYHTEKYSNALESYNYILKGNYDVNLKTLAIYSTGKILESMGKFEEAIKRYEEIEEANETGGFLKGLVLMDLGRLYEKHNRFAEAIDRFKEFLIVSPNSVLVDDIKYRISILEGQTKN